MRLDNYLAEKNKVRSRSEAANLIKLGAVLVNGVKASKPSMQIDTANPPTIQINLENYASIGALKLKAALDNWQVELKDKVALDIGASAGGFTSLMLMRGASKVYAVDIGKGLLREELARDKRVISIENTNVRQLSKECIKEACDIITVDLSFISLKLVLGNLKQFLSGSGALIALIKPQFELGAHALNKQGIVKDHEQALLAAESIKEYALECGYKVKGVIPAPLDFPKKNKEYLIYLTL